MSDNEIIILKEEFDGGLKYALYSNFSKYTEAILELVDNSVSNRIEGRLLTISILVNSKSFTIIDMGGKGMSLKDLNTFLKWGKIKPRESKDIGAYSQGGKSAMGYLGEEMILTTSSLGERTQYKIEDNNLHEYKLKYYKVIQTPADIDRGYTQVEIKKLKRNIKEDVLKTLLADTYRPLIENNEVVIKYNGDIIKPIPFPLDNEFKKENFLVDDNIRGWVGRLAAKSGIKGGDEML